MKIPLIIKITIKLASIFSGGMLGIFLLAAFTSFKRSGAVVAGTLLGVLVILYLSAGPVLFGDQIPGGRIHSYLTIVIGTMVIFLAGFVISWLAAKKRSSQ